MNINTVPPGTVLMVDCQWFWHTGILTEALPGRERTVISASSEHGEVIEQSVAAFAAGREVRVEGYLGSLPPEHVLVRARAMLGKRYDLLVSNCEHFVRYAHGLVPISPQLWKALGVAAVCLVVIAGIARGR